MPLQRSVTIGATGTAGPYNLDPSIAPFSVAIQVFVPGGVTVSYLVEFTLDSLSNPNARWVQDPQFPAASAATITGNYIVPVSGVRVVVASISGGSIELKINQAFSVN